MESDPTFDPVSSPAGDFGLSSIATVRTIFAKGMPTFSGADISRLNRRAVYGNFLCADSTVELKLTYPIYDLEPAHQWAANVLLRALGEQLAPNYALPVADIEAWENAAILSWREAERGTRELP
jgi:hypothetical protein